MFGRLKKWKKINVGDWFLGKFNILGGWISEISNIQYDGSSQVYLLCMDDLFITGIAFKTLDIFS